jgi:hypothetical protein
MSANMTPIEQTAFNLLRNSPEEIQKVAQPNGTINLSDIHRYFKELSRKMEYAQIIRKNEYIDIEHNKEV